MSEVLEFLKDNLLSILGFLGITAAGVIVWLRRNLASFNAEPFLPTVPLKILVSPLLHDPENRQTDHVVDALRTHLKAGEVKGHCDYRVLPKPVNPKTFASGSAQGQRIATRIQRLIALYNADLMIWGHVVKDDHSLHLAITARQAADHHGNRRYPLDGPTLTLPEDFTGDLGAAIAALVVGEASAVTDRLGEYIVPQARAIAAATAPLIDSALPGMTDKQKGDLREAAARAHTFVGMQAGENAPLETAIRAYRMAAENYRTAELRDQWAATQNNLGNALTALGERENDTVRLKRAVDAYREALKNFTRDRVPLEWATTQNNLGNALAALGEHETGTERLDEAVAAYREALSVRTRDRVPLDWAMTQNNLGAALLALGQRDSGTERLEQAVAAYREALKEWARDRVPLQWAITQYNLGEVHIDFFEKTGDPAYLDTARSHTEAALEVFREANATHYIAMAEEQLAKIPHLRSPG